MATIWDRDGKHGVERPLNNYDLEIIDGAKVSFCKAAWSSVVGWGIIERASLTRTRKT